MVDYTKQCWYCNSSQMVNKGTYYQCEACGTTHCELPEIKTEPVRPPKCEKWEHPGKAFYHGAPGLKPLPKTNRRD